MRYLLLSLFLIASPYMASAHQRSYSEAFLGSTGTNTITVETGSTDTISIPLQFSFLYPAEVKDVGLSGTTEIEVERGTYLISFNNNLINESTDVESSQPLLQQSNFAIWLTNESGDNIVELGYYDSNYSLATSSSHVGGNAVGLGRTILKYLRGGTYYINVTLTPYEPEYEYIRTLNFADYSLTITPIRS